MHALPQPMEAARLGVQAYLGFSLFPADIGPVTLTADPAVFQRELRELYVQVGCSALAAGALGPSSQSPQRLRFCLRCPGPRWRLLL